MARRPDNPRPGLVVIDKPQGLTSHDVVSRVRRLAHTRKVGHGGTLDPMATGVLVIGIGKATKLFTWVSGHSKEYRATIRFGVATNTLTLVPATALIGYGQALIVNSFYRIGMRDISASDAGAGSAILSTLQQATLGLGPAILGSLFLALARRGGGNYPQALIDFLLVEVAMMLLLGAIALWLRHHLNRQPATVAS